MLVIAVTGGVGAGKTSLLGRLADWYSAEGRKVDGFLAVAGRRPAENAGAERYDLVMLSDRRTLPFAIRDDSCRPPYRFEESTFGVLRSWAGDIAARDRLPVLVLDEFGPLEAAGKGHAPLWPLVRAASPEVVVLAVREGLESAVQGALGISFDLRIEAKAGDAWERLLEACLEHKDWIRVGLFGAASGGFEASVGAILHGAQVPLRGRDSGSPGEWCGFRSSLRR
jgi:nucleoside-triphosphatase THEP1